jgi:16S rRNA processing protein RimM
MARKELRAAPSPARRSASELAVGRIVRPHGVEGAMVLEGLAEVVGRMPPGGRLHLGPDRHPHTVAAIRPHGKRFLLWLEGVDDFASAEARRGMLAYAREGDLAPLRNGLFYTKDLLGMPVYDEGEGLLGELEQVLRTGANDVWLIRTGEGKELLLPAISSVVLSVDPPARRIAVRLPPGIEAERKPGGAAAS